MLSEKAKEDLKMWKRSLGEWKYELKDLQDCLNNKEKFLERYKEFMQGSYPKTEEEMRKSTKEREVITQEIVDYLENWHKSKIKEDRGIDLIVYHPSIEKEIGSKYGKQGLNFEIIMSVLVIIFLFILLRRR